MKIGVLFAAALGLIAATPALAFEKESATVVVAQNASKNAKRPPAADAVWDVRSACLQGEVETKRVSDKDRLKACDELAKFETKAQEAGYCWNPSYAEYKRCEQP